MFVIYFSMKWLKHKKGGMSIVAFLTAFTLIGILTIIIVLFASRTGVEVKEELLGWKNICKTSVDAHAALHVKGFDFSSAIECPTNNITIKGDLRKEEVQEIAKRTIANAMADCWEAFGEGRKNLFSGQGVFCNVCHIIDFEDSKTLELNGFENYFYNERVPGKPGFTYSEYISGISFGEMFRGTVKYSVEKDVLDISQPYAVVFYYPKGQDYIKQTLEIVGKSYPELLVGGGIIALGFGVVKVGAVISATVIGKVVGIPLMILGGLVIGIDFVIGLFSTKGPDEWAAFTFLMPYTNETLKGCTYLPVKQGEWWKIGETVEI